MNGITDDNTDGVFQSIEEDLTSNNSHLVDEATKRLEKVLQKSDEKLPIVDRLRTHIERAVMDCTDTAFKIFDMFELDLNLEDGFDIIVEACVSLQSDMMKKLLCDVIIPEMFNTDDVEQRTHDVIINIGFQLIEKFPITNLSSIEIRTFTSTLIDKYIKILEKFREQNYRRWHDLWIFLVRFSAKHLHIAMDLANNLLRVVEFAFRNPSYEQRLKGYECWKELIDNASLDMNHMCSSKQIKLLITPLRAKFSKMEVVICKRFEVFLYLLEKLQNQSVLCLNEFLEFCFGVTTNVMNSSKNGQGKLVPNLWLKSIQVFLAILGDQTQILADSGKPIFDTPVINQHNINQFNQVIVCSVIESSIILKHISIPDQEKISILSSLWEALFNIIIKSTQENQERCFQRIFGSLSTIFNEFNEGLTYVGMFTAFIPLLESSIDFRLISDSLKLLLEYSWKFLGEKTLSDEVSTAFCDLMVSVCKVTNLSEFVLEQIKKTDPQKNKLLIYKIWTALGSVIIDNPDVDSKLLINYLLWPVNHLDKFDDNLSSDYCSTWKKIYIDASKVSITVKKQVIVELEKNFKSNPLLSSNITSLISTLQSEELNFDGQYVNPLLKLMAEIMSLPLLSQECTGKMLGLLMKCIQVVSAEETVNLEYVDYVCQCVEKLPTSQKNLAVLDALEKIVENMKPHANSTTGRRLKNLLNTFNSNNTPKRSHKLSMFSSPQESTNGHSPGSLKRSLRMTQMVFEQPNSKETKDKVDSLQFFGRDVQTMTPLRVKGSMLQNLKSPSPSSRSKKIINSVKKQLKPEPPVIEDQTCDFVVINTEVKLQKDKLTEHQKEEMKRRREDIPALYQDLSQSQTQGTSSNSRDISCNSQDIQNKEKIDEDAGNQLKKDVKETMTEVEESHTNENVDVGQCITAPSFGNFSSIRKLEENSSSIDSSNSVNKSNRRRSEGRAGRELMRIQMDIVGGDTFLQNLPSKRPRKLLEIATKSKQKKTEQEVKETGQTEKQKLKMDEQTIERDSPDERRENISKDDLQIEKPSSLDATSEMHAEPSTSNEVIATIGEKQKEQPVATDVVNTPTTSVPVVDDKSNSRKNKFMKPKKHVDSPKTKLKSKTPDKDTPPPRKKRKTGEKLNPIKAVRKEISTSTPSSKEPATLESEILFESEIEPKQKRGNVTKKSNKSVVQNQKVPNENSLDSGQIKQKLSVDGLPKTKKPTKRPTEVMKKNKEKVKTIQSQLKLANLGNLSDSTEPKKAKSAKLIFIREITSSKSNPDIKVASPSLIQNRDKELKNIACTIDQPAASLALSSISLDVDSIHRTHSKIGNKDAEKIEVEEKSRKRKRRTSGSTSDSPKKFSPSAIIDKNPNRSKSRGRGKVSSTVDEIKPADTVTLSDKISQADDSSNIESNTSMTIVKTVKENEVLNISEKTSVCDSSVLISLVDSPTRITRSRSLTVSPNCNSNSPPKRESTKVVKSLFTDSEDIIESSQDSQCENLSKSITNLTRNKIKHSPKLQNTSSNHERTEINVLSPNISIEILDPPNKNDVPENISQFTSQADTESCKSSFEPEPLVVQVDLPPQPELTDSEKMISLTDTVSLVSQTSCDKDISAEILELEVELADKLNSENTNNNKIIENPSDGGSLRACSPINSIEVEVVSTPDKHFERDLPGSPISNVTPTLTKQLLDSTLDISPISSKVNENLDENDDMIQALDEALNDCKSSSEESLKPSVPTVDAKYSRDPLKNNERSAKLLNLVNVESPVSHKTPNKKKLFSPAPVKTRYEKLFPFLECNKEGDKSDATDSDDVFNKETIDNLLTFTREVPSPLAVPGSSILKRKLGDAEDGSLPCAKRKRVNFSYPCVSSLKMYIRHKEEMNPYFRPFPQNFMELDLEEDDEDDPFAYPKPSQEINSEESIDVVNSLLLCEQKPIYEQLIDCEESVDVLWKRLSSPMYCDILKRNLKSKNINTIGDLARLTERDINRLPFKQPRIKTVRKALNFYYNSSYKKSKNTIVLDSPPEGSSNLSVNEESDKQEIVEIECNTIQDLKENEKQKHTDVMIQFKNIISEIKEQELSLEEFGSIFLDSIEETEVITLLKSVYNTDFKKLFKKSDWRSLIETIIQSDGTTELFDILSDQAENDSAFAEKLEFIVQQRITQISLKDIIKSRKPIQLKDALNSCIEEDIFEKKDILQNCLLPLIKNPNEIKIYFNTLTIVQLHDLLIERIQPSDLGLFLDQLRDHYGKYTLAQHVNKNDVLNICSKEELVTSIIEKQEEVQTVKQLVVNIRDPTKLMELYKYIGSMLPVKNRMDCHIDFLKSLSFESDKVE